MPYIYKKDNISRARALRKNMTPEEKKLWYAFLKKLPYTVNRQKAIGPYIVDFYCHVGTIVIELDGAQHYEPEAKAKDVKRDKYLEGLGIMVLRYTNIQIHETFDGVCYDIAKNIEIRMSGKRK